MIDWKRKLTSRKFWVAVATFVSMLVVALGRDKSEAQQWVGLIMAGASMIAYIIGEGLADSGHGSDPGETTYHYEFDDPVDGCTEDGCQITYHDEEV